MRYLLVLLMLSAVVRAEDNPLKPIAKNMERMADALRLDRHDVFTRASGQVAEDKLAGMIDKIEKSQQEQQKQQREQEKQKQPQQRQEQRQQLGSKPQMDSKLGPDAPPGPTQDAAKVVKEADKWAKLPPAMRDQMLQSFSSDIPERWRKRLEAYYISIAAAETEKK